MSGIEFALQFTDADARGSALRGAVAEFHGKDRDGLTCWRESLEDAELERVVGEAIERLEKN